MLCLQLMHLTVLSIVHMWRRVRQGAERILYRASDFSSSSFAASMQMPHVYSYA